MKNIEDLLKSKENMITQIVYKISESNSIAIDLDHQSATIDKELTNFEAQNAYQKNL